MGSKKMSSIRSTAELACQLGISRWAVSRALNGRSGVSAETSRRVREAMARSGFLPSPLAQGLRGGRTRYVGICLPELESFYLEPKLELLRAELSGRGFQVIVGMTDGDPANERAMLRQFGALRTAAIVAVASSQPRSVIQALEAQGARLLLVDPLREGHSGGIAVNRRTGMREATAHLLEQGHRRFGLLGILGDTLYTRRRLEGVALACSERGLAARRAVRSIALPDSGGSELQKGFEAAGTILRLRPVPTAILALNDLVALGLIRGLQEAGLAVPGDISVVGYDNREIGAFSTPKLTTIDAHPDALMRQVAADLLAMIEGGVPNRTGTLWPETNLVVRDSSGPATSARPACSGKPSGNSRRG